MRNCFARYKPEASAQATEPLTRRGRGRALIARRSPGHWSRSAESGVIDALGVVRDNEKASRGIFAPTVPVDASNERHGSAQAPERLVGAPRRAGGSGCLSTQLAVKDGLRRRHAACLGWTSARTASRKRLERPGEHSRSRMRRSCLKKGPAHYVSFPGRQIAHA